VTRHTSRGPVAIAFPSFGPLRTSLYFAGGNGSDARPFLSDPLMHYKACISHNGGGVIFTSDRAGSADIFRASSDGSGWQRFTVDRAFDDFGMLSPDGRWLAFVSTRAAQDVLYETGVSGAQIGRHADPKFESFISLGVDL